MSNPGAELRKLRPIRTVTCDVCGTVFQASDTKARFCSNRCKQQHKRGEIIVKSIHKIFHNGQHIGNQLARTPNRACALWGAKAGIPWQQLTAVDAVSSNERIEAVRRLSMQVTSHNRCCPLFVENRVTQRLARVDDTANGHAVNGFVAGGSAVLVAVVKTGDWVHNRQQALIVAQDWVDDKLVGSDKSAVCSVI